jgi:hypothetical protein
MVSDKAENTMIASIKAFISDLVSDGYKIVGIAAPLLSILYTGLKFWEIDLGLLKEVSYAWALLPLTVWLLIAYSRRRSAHISLLMEATGVPLALARLRHKGVQIRNKAKWNFNSAEEFNNWKSSVEKWMEEVISALETHAPADAEWFRVLDSVPSPRIHCAATDRRHLKLFKEHDYRLVRLDELLSHYRKK